METVAEAVETIEEKPRSVRVSVPLAECSLAEARDIVDDASLYDRTRMAILHHFAVPVGDYWDLTVRDHGEMVIYLSEKGLL